MQEDFGAHRLWRIRPTRQCRARVRNLSAWVRPQLPARHALVDAAHRGPHLHNGRYRAVSKPPLGSDQRRTSDGLHGRKRSFWTGRPESFGTAVRRYPAALSNMFCVLDCVVAASTPEQGGHILQGKTSPISAFFSRSTAERGQKADVIT